MTTVHLNDSLPKISTMDKHGSSLVGAALAEALGYMQRALACPEDVRARIAALRVPADDVPGVRMTTNWRTGPGRREPPPRRGGWHGGGGGNGRSWGPPPQGGYRGRPDRTTMPRFGNKARTDATTEDRMMDRIRDKLNKFSPLTYDATKAWLSQLLDSGETEFLTGFLTLVFEKAAAEPGLVETYARLISELRGAFPHLTVELQRIFAGFLDVFKTASAEPDLGSAAYDAFVALRERQKFRKGYAAFLTHSARTGVFTATDIGRTCDVILSGLMSARVDAAHAQLCEEYAECLKTLMSVGKTPVLLARVRAAADKTESPAGLTNRARFALLDILEM